MVKTIREVAREVGSEFEEGVTQAKQFLRKRVRKPKDMKFAVMPQEPPRQLTIGEMITGFGPMQYRRRR